MQTIKLKDKPFLVIGSSGQEETLTQDIVDNYNSIAINKSPFKVDIIFRYDVPNDNLTKLDMCNYFCTNIKYKDYEKYQNDKCKFFESEYRIISKELPDSRMRSAGQAVIFCEILFPGIFDFLAPFKCSSCQFRAKLRQFVGKICFFARVCAEIG